MNVLGLVGNPGLPTINQAFVDSLFAAVKADAATTSLLALMPGTITFTGLSVRDISQANRAEFNSTGAAVAGTGTGDPLPLSNACCVTIRTAGAGKSFRGRVYITGFNESQNDATGRQAAAVNTACQAFIQAVDFHTTVVGAIIGVLSPPRDAVTIPAVNRAAKPGFVTARTAFETRNTKWESQRRRTGRS